jgi:hypothetical protein
LVGQENRRLIINPLYYNSIDIIGNVDNALPYINSCDIIISYSKSEVLPLSIIESFYCSKPVVTTDVGGISEVIKHGENGFLINNKHECYDSLSKLIENSDRRRAIGEKALATFYSKFNEEEGFKPILDILEIKHDCSYHAPIKRSNILVFMSDNRCLNPDISNADYNSLAAVINHSYCQTYNIDFIYYKPHLGENTNSVFNCLDPNTNELRHASWSKLLSSKKALTLGYEYVVYIDSDCIFKDIKIDLDAFIKKNYTKDIIFINNKPENFDKPCAGFFILKNTADNLEFVKDWYNYKLPTKNKLHAWEQDVLHLIYKQYNMAIVDSTMFSEEKGQFLRHISSHNNSLRVPYFLKHIESNNIDYDVIKEIKVIEFNSESVA